MKSSQLVGAGVFCLLVLGLSSGWAFCFVTVGKGEVGVKSWFGDVDASVLDPGPHFVHPFKSVIRMNVQTQKDEEAATVPTKKGLAVGMKAVLLFHLRPESAPSMAKEVGTNYMERVITPYFKNAVRDVASEFEAEAFYTADRTTVEQRVTERVKKELEPRGIEVESVMLLDPVLPKVLVDRIEAKSAAEQDVLRADSVYKQREIEGKTNKRVKELDAEAKVVEAEGIAKAQKIIKQDLTHEYLVYLWVEALKESAKHNNATIYIPTGNDGMPFFKSVK